jgi:quinol-cytochrome oxidoreductase complex cytochrome b subunit
MLCVQLFSGILLACFYVAHGNVSFDLIENLMRSVDSLWLLRFFHANGASLFFLFVYIHLFRGLYYGSYGYPRTPVWNIGVLMMLLLIAIAFMGYVLPWGQMSFWAATVITNIFSVVPYIGPDLVIWICGGPTVGSVLLTRFFSLHYLLPFVLLVLLCLHLYFLYLPHSGNPLGIGSGYDYVSFHGYFTVKDFLGFTVFGLFYFYLVFLNPNLLGHFDNYTPANPVQTPRHIVPEWYFLVLYAILKSIPNKVGGVITLFLSIFVLIAFSFFCRLDVLNVYRGRLVFQSLLFFLACSYVCLGILGKKTVYDSYSMLGVFATIYVFLFLLVIVPLFSFFDKLLYYGKGFFDVYEVVLFSLIKSNLRLWIRARFFLVRRYLCLRTKIVSTFANFYTFLHR